MTCLSAFLVSLWGNHHELVSRGRIRLDISVESFLQEVESRFVILPMNSRICARAITLPGAYPKDPADRIIGATAIVEGLSLLTADREIRRAGVFQTIWYPQKKWRAQGDNLRTFLGDFEAALQTPVPVGRVALSSQVS